MTTLPRFSVQNPVLVNLLMVAIIIGGAYCALTMIREMIPESRPNMILITTSYPGATPSEVEKGITLKIEEKIKDVKGVEKILSTINEGESTIIAELESGFRWVDQAVNDIKAAIDTIPEEDFPEEARETRVAKFDPRWPVISVALYGNLDDRALKSMGERLRQDMLLLPGTTDVVLSGTRKDEISIEVEPARLAEFGMSFMDVAQVIATSNLDLPGGQVRTEDANVAVRTLGEKGRAEDLLELVLSSDPAGRAIRLRDVAQAFDTFEDVDVAGRFNALPAVNVTVFKTPEQDAVKIAGAVRALVAGKLNRPLIRPARERFLAFVTGNDPLRDIYERARSDPYPPGIGVEVHTDLSRFIEGRLELLQRNGFWGLILVTLSLLVFLHWRVAFWVMMGLMLAIAGALIAMTWLGQTLNLMTMFGLIIVLGLLVDDAIIVSEHVYSKVEQGVEPRLAAITGAEEVTWPVFCAVTTTIVAFVPLMFIEGQIGDWMGVLPVIVCVALSASLIESLAILPCHLAHGLRLSTRHVSPKLERRARTLSHWITTVREAQDNLVNVRLRNGYERFLRAAVSYRYITMAALTSCLIIAVGAVAGGHVPFVLLQKMDSETVVANLKMGVGTPIEGTREAAKLIERAALDLPERKTVYTLLGTQLSDNGLTSAPQAHLAQVYIELVAAEDRNRNSDVIINELRDKTANIPGVRKLTFASIQGGTAGAAIHLEISGSRIEDLVTVSERLQRRLTTYEGIMDIVDDFDAGRREVQIELLDSARALGLTTQSLATQVRSAFYGYEARKIQRGREDVRIMVRYPPEHRRRVYDIEAMRIAAGDQRFALIGERGNTGFLGGALTSTISAGGSPAQATQTLVPFTEVARLREGTGFASIKRKNQQRTVTITADVDSNVTSSDQVMAELSNEFPELSAAYPGMSFEFGGQKLETRKSFASLKTDFIAALILIYVILAGLFRTYIQPLLVMAVIPFGLIGAVVGHFIMGYPLTILSLIGLVALTGIVVNDSMILVVFVNRRVAAGADMFESVIEGGKSRLRPILLTSATTVLGMAPLLAERSFQAKFLIPMGISISAGLIFATILTLIAIPSLYLILNDVKIWLTGKPVKVLSADALAPVAES
jgi:hydrophobic/amphiphilic exporter-1 (mainly G- bacteria), HAE1 family